MTSKEQLAINHLFAPTKQKWAVQFIRRYGKAPYLTWNCEVAQHWDRLERLALNLIGEKSKATAYQNGKADEANKVADNILKELME